MIFFYILSMLCLAACTLLVSARNPVYSLLSLVLVFICGSLLLLSLGVDFLAYVFLIVYVGALAVLFLFVVIMLDIKISKLQSTPKELPLVLLGAVFCFAYLEFTMPNLEIEMDSAFSSNSFQKYGHLYDDFPIIKSLGFALYTKYVIHFVLCGLVLLVAILGAIVLTSKGRYQKNKEKEKQFKQCERFSKLGKHKTSTST